MSLDKSIESGKEHRKQYSNKEKDRSKSERNQGKQHAAKKQTPIDGNGNPINKHNHFSEE